MAEAGGLDNVRVFFAMASHEEIADVVTSEIAKVPGVTGTHTMIAFRAYASEDLERLWGVGFDDAEGV